MSDKQRHFSGVVTLTGAAQKVSTALGLSTGLHVRDLSIQPDKDNLNAFGIGHASTLTLATCGVLMPAPVSGVPSAPYIRDGFYLRSVSLDEFYVIGTSGEKVHVDVIVNDYSIAQA